MTDNDGVTREEIKEAAEELGEALQAEMMRRSPFLRRGEKQEATIELRCGGTMMIEYWEPKERPDDASPVSQEERGYSVALQPETIAKIEELQELKEYSVTFKSGVDDNGDE